MLGRNLLQQVVHRLLVRLHLFVAGPEVESREPLLVRFAFSSDLAPADVFVHIAEAGGVGAILGLTAAGAGGRLTSHRHYYTISRRIRRLSLTPSDHLAATCKNTQQDL